MATGVVVTQLTTSGGPPGVRGQPYGCIHPNGLIYYFGGNDGPALGDTWSFNPATDAWAQLTTATAAPANVAVGIYYDPISAKIIMFGGDNESTWFSDTYTLDPTVGSPNWTHISPATVPGKRSGHNMFADPVTGNIMMYGGNTGTPTYMDDLWRWNGTNWVSVSSALTGNARTGAFCATLTDGTTIIFGGFDSGVRNDTNRWNGTTCSRLAPSTVPPARGFGGGAADNTGLMLIYGGANRASTVNSTDCWLWNGFDWTLVTPTGDSLGPGLSSQSLVWHPGTAKMYSAFGTQGPTGNPSGDINKIYSIKIGTTVPTGPTITHVQTVEGSGTNLTTIAIKPTQVGNLLSLKFDIESGTANSSITGITDGGITPVSGAGAWQLVKASPVDPFGNYGRTEQWMATTHSVPGSSVTVTIALSGASGAQNDLQIDEYNSGLGPGTIWSTVADGSSSSTSSTTSMFGASLTATGTQQLYEAYFSCSGTGAPGTSTGFTYFVSMTNQVLAYNTTIAPLSTVQGNATQTSAGYNSTGAIFSANVHSGGMIVVLGL